MASWETLAAFAAVLVVFAYVPGPAILYAAAQTLARGRKAGLLAAVGLHVGGYVHVAAAAFGLSALLALVPGVYLAVKLAGALYLVWLGISIVWSGRSEHTQLHSGSEPRKHSTLSQSIIVEILNPKAAMFFLADFVVSRMKNSGPVQRAFRWVAGFVLVGLGAKLAMESQR